MTKEIVLFLTIGGIQYITDGFLFYLFISINLDIVSSNILSRGIAALIGFELNRRFTFNFKSKELLIQQFKKFVLGWVFMTILNTTIMGLISIINSQKNFLTIAKLITELIFAIASFLICKYWIYKK